MPYTTLPGDWESDLSSLSTNTRQKIRRLLKLVDASSEYRITVSTPETFEQDLKTLLRFWEIKWRPRKEIWPDNLVRSNGTMLRRSFSPAWCSCRPSGTRDQPVAALATLIGSPQADLFVLHNRARRDF